MSGNVPSLLRPTARRGRLWHPVALMTVPAAALLAVFVYWPVLRAAYLSTQGVNLFGQPTGFVGLRYYTSYFADAANRASLVVTLEFTAATVVLTLVPAVLLTVYLTGQQHAGKLASTVFSLPFAYSASSASVLFAAIYNPATGILDVLLHKMGAGQVDWLGSPALALISVAAATAWWQLGFAVLVLTAAMRGLPAEVVEAARLDGAGFWTIRRRVILPLISPSVFFLLVTGSISGVQTFTQIALLTRGGPSGSTTTLVYDFYLRAFGNGLADYGRASAIAMILLLLVILMTAFQFGVLERRVHYR
jgi:sn-glycerol 3-phosphate transport system permease protein